MTALAGGVGKLVWQYEGQDNSGIINPLNLLRTKCRGRRMLSEYDIALDGKDTKGTTYEYISSPISILRFVVQHVQQNIKGIHNHFHSISQTKIPDTLHDKHTIRSLISVQPVLSYLTDRNASSPVS